MKQNKKSKKSLTMLAVVLLVALGIALDKLHLSKQFLKIFGAASAKADIVAADCTECECHGECPNGDPSGDPGGEGDPGTGGDCGTGGDPGGDGGTGDGGGGVGGGGVGD